MAARSFSFVPPADSIIVTTDGGALRTSACMTCLSIGGPPSFGSRPTVGPKRG